MSAALSKLCLQKCGGLGRSIELWRGDLLPQDGICWASSVQLVPKPLQTRGWELGRGTLQSTVTTTCVVTASSSSQVRSIMSCVIRSHFWNRVTHDGQGTWCGLRVGVLTWNICIVGSGHFPDQFYFTLSGELGKSWLTMGIAVNRARRNPSAPPKREFHLHNRWHQGMPSDLMEGNSRAFPAWPNEPEAYEAGGGRKGERFGPEWPGLLDLSYKGKQVLEV